ncbi:MAG TPA: hypothetical protein VF972_07470 [Actinomycetota bacterium]
MTVWDVHPTYRDAGGGRRTDFYGAFTGDELSRALETALEQADARGGGVQVTRQRPLPASAAGPRDV